MQLYEKIVINNIRNSQFKNEFDMLDVGCGNGDFVFSMMKKEYNCFGIDVVFKPGVHTEELIEKNRISLIEIGTDTRETLKSGSEYKWPLLSNEISVICSRAVLEHVANLDQFVKSSLETFSGNSGLCIHYFPSRFSLIEPHVGIPFGALIQNYTYYNIMCRFGFCFKKFKQNPEKAYKYVKTFTMYRNMREIDHTFQKYGFYKIKSIGVMSCHENSLINLLGKVPIFNYIFEILRTKVCCYKHDGIVS